jgi:hypothetical protein
MKKQTHIVIFTALAISLGLVYVLKDDEQHDNASKLNLDSSSIDKVKDEIAKAHNVTTEKALDNTEVIGSDVKNRSTAKNEHISYDDNWCSLADLSEKDSRFALNELSDWEQSTGRVEFNVTDSTRYIDERNLFFDKTLC